MSKTIQDTRLAGLYAITDAKTLASANYPEKIESVLKGGAALLQYRNKPATSATRLQQATRLRQLCRRYGALFIINDDPELCAAVDADGVHLGRTDTGIEAARRCLGEKAIIGASCYGDLSRARRARDSGASYLAFGAVFPSTTKPEAASVGTAILGEAKRLFDLPVCAIGGITTTNAPAIIAAGADMLAVISHLFDREHPETTARCFHRQFPARRQPDG